MSQEKMSCFQLRFSQGLDSKIQKVSSSQINDPVTKLRYTRDAKSCLKRSLQSKVIRFDDRNKNDIKTQQNNAKKVKSNF